MSEALSMVEARESDTLRYMTLLRKVRRYLVPEL